MYINCKKYTVNRDIPFIYSRPGFFLLHVGPSPGVQRQVPFFLFEDSFYPRFYPLVVIFFPRAAAGRDFFLPKKTAQSRASKWLCNLEVKQVAWCSEPSRMLSAAGWNRNHRRGQAVENALGVGWWLPVQLFWGAETLERFCLPKKSRGWELKEGFWRWPDGREQGAKICTNKMCTSLFIDRYI